LFPTPVAQLPIRTQTSPSFILRSHGNHRSLSPEQIAIKARQQAGEAGDPVPPIGSTYSRERFRS
jgi:hypothetical protein